MRKTALNFLIALFALGSAIAAGLPDSKAIVGTWKAVQGTYSDGTFEKELDMAMTFTATTMSDPMSKEGRTYRYALDERKKSISVKERGLEMKIAYRFDGMGDLVLTELTVIKDGKTTSVIGQGATAMFTELLMSRRN